MPTPFLSYRIPSIGISVQTFKTGDGTLCGSVTVIRENESMEDVENDDVCSYEAGIMGVESLLLAMVCEGIDLREEKFERAIQVTLDALMNNLG